MSHSNALVGSRARSLSVLAIALAALAVASIPASAASAGRRAAGPTTTTTAPTCPPSGRVDPSIPEILTGVTVGPALVVTPGRPNRTLTASQATAFLQSWLPASVVQHLPSVPAPPAASVSHLLLSTTYSGGTACIIAWYAAVHGRVFVGMPAQSLGWASVQKDTWIAAPNPSFSARAFAGKAKPVQGATSQTTTTTATSTTTGSASAKSSGSSGSSGWVWFVVAGVIVLAMVGGIALRSRRPRAAG